MAGLDKEELEKLVSFSGLHSFVPHEVVAVRRKDGALALATVVRERPGGLVPLWAHLCRAAAFTFCWIVLGRIQRHCGWPRLCSWPCCFCLLLWNSQQLGTCADLLTRIVQYPVLCCRPDGRQFYQRGIQLRRHSSIHLLGAHPDCSGVA